MQQTKIGDTLEKLMVRLRSQKATLALAESCTGGLLSAAVAAIPGVSDIYQGAVVSYSYQSKVDLLGVPWALLSTEGAVSDKVACLMAQGACQKFNATWSVGITGIAGPTGGTPDKPVGTVWFGIAGPQFVTAQKMIFAGSREEIQRQSAEFAAEFLLKSIG